MNISISWRLGLDTEGIFRRSANANILKQVQKQFNEGKTVDFAVRLLDTFLLLSVRIIY